MPGPRAEIQVAGLLRRLRPGRMRGHAKARLSAVLDDVRDTHDRVVITRNGRPEAVIISVADLETLDLLSTPGAIDEIRTAEAETTRGEGIGADELRRLMAERVRNERNAG